MTNKHAPDQSNDSENALTGPKRYLNWQNIRDIALVALIAVVAYKLARAPWAVNIDRFSFTDLLSLLLALFSVGLSVFFYQMAEQSGLVFQSKSFEFMNNASVLLGRIEERFGERLDRIVEQNIDLKTSLSGRLVEAKEEEKQKTEAVVQVASALTAHGGLSPEEQSALIESLRVRAEELNTTRAKVGQLQKELTAAKLASFTGEGLGNVMDFIASQVADTYHAQPPEQKDLNALLEGEALRAEFGKFAPRITPNTKATLLAEGLIAADGTLTVKGIDYLRKMIGPRLSRP